MERNITFDIAKGIGIVFVMIGHCRCIPYMPYQHFIYTFHMPLFFIISGFFYKPKDIKVSLRKDIRRLMIPYFITCTIIVAIMFLLSWRYGDFDLFKYSLKASLIGSGFQHATIFYPNEPTIGAIWFLLALFVCKNLYNLLLKYSLWEKLIITSILYVLANISGTYLFYLPMSILSGIAGMMFYCIGEFLHRVKNVNNKYILYMFGLICWCISFCYGDISLVIPRSGLYHVDVVGSTFASCIILTISKKLSKITKFKTLLSWMGTSTLFLLCVHSIDQDCTVTYKIISKLSLPSYYDFILTILIPIISLAILTIYKKLHRILSMSCAANGFSKR